METFLEIINSALGTAQHAWISLRNKAKERSEVTASKFFVKYTWHLPQRWAYRLMAKPYDKGLREDLVWSWPHSAKVTRLLTTSLPRLLGGWLVLHPLPPLPPLKEQPHVLSKFLPALSVSTKTSVPCLAFTKPQTQLPTQWKKKKASILALSFNFQK